MMRPRKDTDKFDDAHDHGDGGDDHDDTALEIWVAGRSLDLDRRAIREMDRLDAFLEHLEGGRIFRLRRRRPLVHWTGGLALECLDCLLT